MPITIFNYRVRYNEFYGRYEFSKFIHLLIKIRIPGIKIRTRLLANYNSARQVLGMHDLKFPFLYDIWKKKTNRFSKTKTKIIHSSAGKRIDVSIDRFARAKSNTGGFARPISPTRTVNDNIIYIYIVNSDKNRETVMILLLFYVFCGGYIRPCI